MTEPGWFYSGRYDHGLRSLCVLPLLEGASKNLSQQSVIFQRRLVDYAHRTATWVAAVFYLYNVNGDATLWLSGVGVSEGSSVAHMKALCNFLASRSRVTSKSDPGRKLVRAIIFKGNSKLPNLS